MEYPMIGSHVEAYPLEEDKLQIFNRNTGKTYTLGKNESSVYQLLNGANTIDDVLQKCSCYSRQETEELIKAFSNLGFFDKVKRKFNPFKIKFRLLNPNKLIKPDSVITKLLHYTILFLCPLLFISGIITHQVIIKDSLSFYSQVLNGVVQLSFSDWLAIAFLSLACLALHECAHMITARKYGVNVPEIGVMLYFLIPCAYTNISGINLLKSKARRLIVLVSGSLVNFAVIGVCNIIMCSSASKTLISFSAAIALANIGTIFMNMMVLLRFDGYYALEVMLDEPKLRENAINYIVTSIKKIFDKNKSNTDVSRQALHEQDTGLKHFVYGVYFAFSMGYIPVILMNTVLPFFTK